MGLLWVSRGVIRRAVRGMSSGNTLDEDNSGNAPFDSTAVIDSNDLDALPYDRLLKYAERTAKEMSAERGNIPLNTTKTCSRKSARWLGWRLNGRSTRAIRLNQHPPGPRNRSRWCFEAQSFPEVRMPIYYACESEEQAKEKCLKMRGLYVGRSRYSALYTWQAFSGACITTFTRPTVTGLDRFMVVYNEEAGAFESIAIESDSSMRDHLIVGGDPDAPVELRARYSHYLDEREEARHKAKRLLLCKVRSLDEARLRKIKGKTVQVIAGTTIKHGTKGRVFWVGFGEKGDPRVGFYDVDGNRRWTALQNIQEVQYLPLLEQAS